MTVFVFLAINDISTGQLPDAPRL